MTHCAHSENEILKEGYYGWECPLCGQLVYPYGSSPWEESFETVEELFEAS